MKHFGAQSAAEYLISGTATAAAAVAVVTNESTASFVSCSALGVDVVGVMIDR
jgi:hypothetical protein